MMKFQHEELPMERNYWIWSIK